MDHLARRQAARPAKLAPQLQNLLLGILVADIVDDLVERLVFAQSHITISQRFGRFEMILRIHVEFHFEQTGRHLEIADEKMVYRGTFEQLQYGLIAPILPIEPDFVLVRNQIDQLLNPVVPQIARPLDIALALAATGLRQNGREIVRVIGTVRRIGDHISVLGGRDESGCFDHFVRHRIKRLSNKLCKGMIFYRTAIVRPKNIRTDRPVPEIAFRSKAIPLYPNCPNS